MKYIEIMRPSDLYPVQNVLIQTSHDIICIIRWAKKGLCRLNRDLNDWFTWMTGLKSYRTGCRQWLSAKELYMWDSAAIISCSKNSNIVVGHLELMKTFLSFMQKNKNKNDKPNKHIANYKFVWAVWILHWA